MGIRNVWSGVLALGMIWVIGCGRGDDGPQPGSEAVGRYIDETPPVDLSRQDVVAATLAFSDPDMVMFVGTFMPLFLDTEARSIDPDCPGFIDQSDRAAEIVDWRIQGDCTAMDELGVVTRYEGQIVATGDASGTVIRYEDFRIAEAGDCNGAAVEMVARWEGEVQVPFAFLLEGADAQPPDPEQPMDGDGYPPGPYVVSILFELRDVDEACKPATSGLAYDVLIDIMVENPDDVAARRDIVQMDGHAARRDTATLLAELAPAGSWTISVDDYVLAPNMCSSEPLAGTMTVKAGGAEATVRPDGATSCAEFDEPPCAPWSHNGTAQPEQICNYTGCSAGPDAPPPWIALAILLAGLLWQRRPARCRARG